MIMASNILKLRICKSKHTPQAEPEQIFAIRGAVRALAEQVLFQRGWSNLFTAPVPPTCSCIPCPGPDRIAAHIADRFWMVPGALHMFYLLCLVFFVIPRRQGMINVTYVWKTNRKLEYSCMCKHPL